MVVLVQWRRSDNERGTETANCHADSESWSVLFRALVFGALVVLKRFVIGALGTLPYHQVVRRRLYAAVLVCALSFRNVHRANE
jgi:hypothetical protein